MLQGPFFIAILHSYKPILGGFNISVDTFIYYSSILAFLGSALNSKSASSIKDSGVVSSAT